MIEAYAFLVMFTVQILAMSVLYPAWFVRFTRMKMENYYADERFAQLYPGTERTGVERFLTRYRALNMGIAVLGLLLLGWMYSYTRRPDWDDGPVETLAGMYFVLQVLPLLLVAFLSLRSNKKALRNSTPDVKRKASLQRRGVFDFVSPFVVSIAVLGYFLYAAFVMYIEQHPFQAFAGAFINIGVVTLVYALNAFIVYMRLYGRKSDPLETRADRVRMTGVTVKASVYTCIAVVVFISLNFTLVLLDLQRWEPFAQSIFLVICTLLGSMGLTAAPRRPVADVRDSSPVS